MAEQPLSEKTWVKVTAWALLSGAVSLAVSMAVTTWKARDYIDARDDRLLAQIRTAELSRYLSKDEYYAKREADAEKINAKLELILDKIRSHR